MTDNSPRLRAIFAPDWRNGVPYQSLLAGALDVERVDVSFLQGYRRLLPLSRALHAERRGDTVFHLHWPEAYFGTAWMRCWRHGWDLHLVARRFPIVVTAHNLYPHDHRHLPAVRRAMRASYRAADAIIAHSPSAARQVGAEFGVNAGRIHIVPQGNLATELAPLPAAADARQQLGLGSRPVCLVFGVAAPYKGLEALIRRWREGSMPGDLWIVGEPKDEAFAQSLREMSGDAPTVHLLLERLSDDALRTWLGAADAVVFNYEHSLTSGAASVARSLGVPVVLPRRLDALDLGEPHSHVVRFDSLAELDRAIALALRVKRDEAAGQPFRETIAWPRIAAATRRIYERVLDSR